MAAGSHYARGDVLCDPVATRWPIYICRRWEAINTISYYRLQSAGMDIVTDFPPIRIWGTIGFILAMWGVRFLGFELSHMQLYIGATLSVLLVHCLPLPYPHSGGEPTEKPELDASMLGLDALRCLK